MLISKQWKKGPNSRCVIKFGYNIVWQHVFIHLFTCYIIGRKLVAVFSDIPQTIMRTDWAHKRNKKQKLTSATSQTKVYKNKKQAL